jgi:hypothetical protein
MHSLVSSVALLATLGTSAWSALGAHGPVCLQARVAMVVLMFSVVLDIARSILDDVGAILWILGPWAL